MLELARRNGVTLPADDVAGLREWFRFRDFRHFIEVYVAISRCLRSAADYELIAYELGAELARQGVRYAEVTFSPSTHELVLGVPHATYFAGITAGRERARREFGIELAWVFDIVRATPVPTAYADYVTRVAIEGQRDGVVALGLGGLEAGNPPEPFAPWFERARAAGLHSAPHAGEIAGPESVWRRPARPGRGAHRPRRPLLGGPRAGGPPGGDGGAPRGLPHEQHPPGRLPQPGRPPPAPAARRRGAPDGQLGRPPLFNTTLQAEVDTLDTAFGFTAADAAAVDEILTGGVRHSFLPPERRASLEAEFRTALARLKPLHLA